MDDIFESYIRDHLAIRKECQDECDGDNEKCEKCCVIFAHRNLRQQLKERLSIMEEVESDGDEDIYSFLTGSYKRGTIIRPPKDVDFFNVLLEDEYKDFTPSEALNILYAALTDIYPDKEEAGEIIPQTHSITVKYSDSFGIDVIPAFEDGITYRIPHVPPPGEGDETWLISNPKIHEEVVHDANEKTGGRLIPIIRLIKKWKRETCKPLNVSLTSFHLELLATDILGGGKIDSIDAGLTKFFTEALQYMDEPCVKDPANADNLVDAELSDGDRSTVKTLLKEAAKIAQLAMQAKEEGNDAEEIRQWKKIYKDLEGKDDDGMSGAVKTLPSVINISPAKPWSHV